MFEIGILALVISFPIFYVYGIIQFLKKNNSEKNSREKVYQELQQAQQKAKTEKEKQAFQIVLEYLSTKQPSLNPPHFSQIATQQPVQSVQAPAKEFVSSNYSPFHSLENINILLYLGAFLLIVACGIFANYSYASWDGLTKTLAIGLFAAVFYSSGLIMYVRFKKVRPAAVVFTTIGLLAMPMVGVVAHNFWFLDSQQFVWFTTSLVCLGLYILSYLVIRHTLLEYLSVFTALSLFQSTIGLFDFPVYVYYWGLAIFSLLLILIGKARPELKSLRIIANVILPISIFLSLLDVPSSLSYIQAGITCTLGSIFYALLSSLCRSKQEKLLALTISALLAPISLLLFWMISLPTLFRPEIGIALMVVSLIYAQISELFSWRKRAQEQQLFANLSSFISLVGVFFTWELHMLNIGLSLISMCVTTFLMYRTRQRSLLFFFGLVLLFLPYEVAQIFPYPKQDFFVSTLYLMTLIGWLATRTITVSLLEGKKLQILGYGTSLIGAFFFVAESAQPLSLLMIGMIAIIFLLLIHFEKLPKLVFLPFCLLYFLVMRAEQVYNLSYFISGSCYLLSAVIIYLAGWLYKDDRSDHLTLLSLLGPFLAFSTGDGVKSIIPSASLLTAGSIILVEGYRKHQQNVMKFAFGVILAGIQLFLYQIVEVTELQVYTLSWAAYFVWLTIHAKESEKDLYTLLALFFATVPLGIQALEDQVRGLALIGEGLGLVLLGIQLKKKLIWQWGVAVLVLEVLYYMRDFLANLPSWAIFGGLGLTLLVGSVILLQRRKTEN